MSYRVDLPVFSGPMDLLLHLVKQQEVDIHEVRIAEILESYLEHLKVLEALDLSDLGDFLVMASTLMELKSREMLPREEVELERELDPRDDLIKRLLEYKRFRDISLRLSRLARRRARMIETTLPLPEELRELQIQAEEELLDLSEIGVWNLTEVFARLLQETGLGRENLKIDIDRRTVYYYAARVLERVRSGGEVGFEQLFDPGEGSAGLIGAFTAILEMMKQGVLWARQDEGFGQIAVTFVGDQELTAEEILAGLHRVDEHESEEPADEASPEIATNGSNGARDGGGPQVTS